MELHHPLPQHQRPPPRRQPLSQCGATPERRRAWGRYAGRTGRRCAADLPNRGLKDSSARQRSVAARSPSALQGDRDRQWSGLDGLPKLAIDLHSAGGVVDIGPSVAGETSQTLGEILWTGAFISGVVPASSPMG